MTVKTIVMRICDGDSEKPGEKAEEIIPRDSSSRQLHFELDFDLDFELKIELKIELYFNWK